MISPASAVNVFNILRDGEPGYAYAYGLNIKDNKIVNHIQIHKAKDIYAVLETVSDNGSGLIWDAIAITTQGWAAPHSETDNEYKNIAPSKHPDRARVLLMCIVTKEREIHSVIKMENEEPQYQPDGKGALSEALLLIYPREQSFHENNNQFYI